MTFDNKAHAYLGEVNPEIGKFIGTNHNEDGIYEDENGDRTLVSKHGHVVMGAALRMTHYKTEADWPMKVRVHGVQA